MDINFRKIDKSNWLTCVNLKVREEQKDYVAPNSYSLVQAHYEDNLHPLGIYNGDTMVGFIMYDYDAEVKMWGMCRLMVDEKFQKKGIGKQAIIKLLDLVRKERGHVDFYTSVEPENEVALKLYESLGFINSNKIIEDELLLTIKL